MNHVIPFIKSSWCLGGWEDFVQETCSLELTVFYSILGLTLINGETRLSLRKLGSFSVVSNRGRTIIEPNNMAIKLS
jgi:hypothetical protein